MDELLMFLGIDEDPADALDRHFDGEPAPCYDLDEMRKMNRKELFVLFRDWAEYTWDNHCGYQLEIIRTPVQP